MKQLKAGCWLVIKKIALSKIAARTTEPMEVDGEEAAGVTTTFTEVLEKIPSVVSEKCAESLSTSLAFYSILHLCNEKGVDIKMHDDLEDFTIIPPPGIDLTQ